MRLVLLIDVDAVRLALVTLRQNWPFGQTFQQIQTH